MQARPTAPAPARIVALAVLEKVVEADVEAGFVSFATRPVWASWASVSSTLSLPSLKLPWQPSGRGRKSSFGKRKKRENALKTKGEEPCMDTANERVSSRASLGIPEASFGKLRRLTVKWKREISFSNHFFYPTAESRIKAWSAWAVRLGTNNR